MGLTFVPEYEFVRPTGFIPSLRNPDDKVFRAGLFGTVPQRFRQLEEFPDFFQNSTEDQRQTSSCTWNAIAVLYEFLHAMQTGSWANFSRMFGYYHSRKKRGWQNSDSGAIISDCFEVAATKGTCLEAVWMFKESLLFTEPSVSAVNQAARHRLIKIERVASEDIYEVLSGNGDPSKARPVVGAFIVHQHRFFAPDVVKSGWIDMPSKTSDYAGWHAMAIAGFDKTEGWIEGPQSWGDDWASQSITGRKGWYRMNAAYLAEPKYSMDFWTAHELEMS